MVNHYQILGLQLGATDAQIKSAYRKLAMKYHPDKNPGNISAEAMMKQINVAYSILCDPKQKQWHDFYLRPKTQKPTMAQPVYKTKSTYTYSYTSTTKSRPGGVKSDTFKSKRDIQILAKQIIGCFIFFAVGLLGIMVYAIYSAFSK